MVALFGGLLPLLVLGGLIFAVVNGLRSVSEDPSDPIEPAEAAKSLALHVGLFVAFVATTVGLIDLLQSAIDRPERLAGASTDLARGLALVIVSGPSAALVLRAVDRRSRERSAAGDLRPTRGGSVYLVVALSTTLIATLISVGQVAYDLTSTSHRVDRSEVAQLVVWFVGWLAHWFGLRPRLGLRGDAHLAIGTVVGLGWLLSGVGTMLFRALESGYDSAFDRPLASSVNLALWLIVGVVGAAVWAWHWWGFFDAPAPGSAVEGCRRASPLWFFAVVVAGILPGLVAIVFSISAVVSIVGIWFLGTVEDSASDFFGPVPGLVAVLFVGFVTWAYHRWVLERHGTTVGETSASETSASETSAHVVRNESIRFHDYLAVAAGLMAVIGAFAALVALMLDTAAGRSSFAGSTHTDNTLIITLTVLGAGAVVWWHYWSCIEVERSRRPLEESDSLWRKLYLITGFGLGGLVLGVSLVWVLFAFLRDLLDAGIGRSTVEELSSPIGWAVAVVGAVWYHFGVWQADRAVLEARQPPPPTGLPVGVGDVAERATGAGLSTRLATVDDAGELFTLQLADAARRLLDGAVDAAPTETFAQMCARLGNSDTTVVVDGHRVVGFVSRTRSGPAGVGIQAVVAPDRNTAEILELLAAGPSPGGLNS